MSSCCGGHNTGRSNDAHQHTYPVNNRTIIFLERWREMGSSVHVLVNLRQEILLGGVISPDVVGRSSQTPVDQKKKEDKDATLT